MKLKYLLCLLFINSISFSSEKVFELNQQNLTLLALKDSPNNIIQEYAFYLVTSTNGKEYFKALIKKDKVRIQELVEVEKKKLIAEISKITKNRTIKTTKSIKYKNHNEVKSTIDIQDFISGTLESIFRSYKKNKGLPDYYYLLFANTEVLSNIKVDSKKFKKLIESRKALHKTQLNDLYLEATLFIPSYQNQHEFQVIIKKIDVYESKNKKILLATKTDNRKSADIINNWYLSAGYTNPLKAIHNFSYLGYGLQEMMDNALELKKTCKEAIKIGKHKTIVCRNPYTQNTNFIVTYIGGVVAQIDIIAQSTLSGQEKAKITKDALFYFKKPRSILQAETTKWSEYSIDFEFYPGALLDKTSKKSLYKFIYNKDEPVENQYTLIATMISQATKKLIEENK